MTNQQILERAIAKAIDGGWEPYKPETKSIYTWLIFNHKFCKALWGEEYPSKVEAAINRDFPCWKRRLQEMVISEDPIAYLGEHI